MMPFRRLTFQLASLLDLLLIVMFSQYLEVQIVAEQQTERMAAEQQASTADRETLRERLNEMQRQLQAWEDQQRRLDKTETEQLEQLGRVFGELFHLPESTIRKIVKQRNQDQAGLSLGEATALKQELQSLAAARGDQIVDHLLTYVEMKKRFDVWELYLQENGAISVTAGTHQKRVQTGIVETPQQFSDELFKIYKSFPQTKSIVLILVSYGDSRLLHRTAVIKGLPMVAERMRADSNGAARFEYAVLGYRPAGAPER
ncbi:MAG: hypothetical protein EXS05_01690 [Planctomycetaceae bacterium]|nr:hypothetical protein [Planctomycetaceae bacterium]